MAMKAAALSHLPPFRFWAFLPALLFLPMVLSPPANHDVAAVLQFTQRWLAGESLYTGLIDVNPPLIFLLNLLPAAIAANTPLGAIAALRLCVLGYGLFCWRLAWLARDRGREKAGEDAIERAFLDALPLLFLLAAGYDFAQREHLMTMAALPYLLAASRRCAGKAPRGQIPIALIAALGFALKPHFLAVPALVELCVLVSLRHRPGQSAIVKWLRDPTPWTLGLTWALYLTMIAAIFPEYFTIVVPLIQNAYLGIGEFTPWQLLILPRLATAYALLLALAAYVFFRRPRIPPGPNPSGDALPRLFALAGIAALAAALVQHKGWSYHIVPIELFACALAGLLASRWLDRIGAPFHPPGAQKIAGVLAGLIGLYVISNGEAPWKQLYYPASEAAGLTRLLAREAGGGRALVLSPGVYPIFPAFNDAGVTSTSRFTDLWALQGAYQTCLPDGRRYREPAEMGRAEAFVWRVVASDFAARPPEAVVVDDNPGIPWCGAEFDFIAYFTRDPAFAETWRRYQLAGRWQRYRVYTLKKDPK